MVVLFIFLCHLQFSPSGSYSFRLPSFASLESFFPSYFEFLDAMVNKTIPLISLSDNLLLVSKTREICIVYPATLMNSLMRSSHFLVVSLAFSMYSIMLYANSVHLEIILVVFRGTSKNSWSSMSQHRKEFSERYSDR